MRIVLETNCSSATLKMARVEPCDRFGGGRETVTFRRVMRASEEGGAE